MARKLIVRLRIEDRVIVLTYPAPDDADLEVGFETQGPPHARIHDNGGAPYILGPLCEVKDIVDE